MKTCLSKIPTLVCLPAPLAGFAQSARLLTTITNPAPISSIAALGTDRVLIGAPSLDSSLMAILRPENGPARHRGMTLLLRRLLLFQGADFLQNLFRNVETKQVRTSLLQSREMFPALKTNSHMKYALLVHVNKEAVDQFKDENAKAAAVAAGRAYGEALRASGVFVAGAGLEPPETATRVSVRNGKRQVHDGPESKEFLGGFVIIDVPNLDAALEWGARNPSASDVFVEVRPVTGSYFAVGAR
jgi:hypothetical protein